MTTGTGNTYFAHKNIHKKTWRSPDGITNNEIDYICISNRWRSALQDVRVYRGADIGSDHHLIAAKLQLRLKKIQTGKTTRPLAVEQLRVHDTIERFQFELKNRFSALENITDLETHWAAFKKAVTDSTETCVGRRKGSQKKRWIQDHTWNLIDERKHAKKLRDQANSPELREINEMKYKNLDRQVKKNCREDKKKWLEDKCSEAQEAANKNDPKTLYRIVRELTGSKNISNVPIKNKNGITLLTNEEQDSRWVEHFREILNQPIPPVTHIFDTSPQVEDLEVEQGEITETEVSEAVKALKNNKAPGIDGITSEMIKAGGQEMI
ncbi:hypothetical protein FO519_010263, partial [Halicephalobus sp. NKZ332]